MILVGGDTADIAFGEATALYALTPDTLRRVNAGRKRPRQPVRRRVSFLSLSPDAETLLGMRYGASGTRLRAIGRRTGSVLWDIPFQENSDETQVAWAADGRRFAIEAGGRMNVWLIDQATGRVLRRARTTGYLGRQAFSPDDRTLALNTTPAQLLDLHTGTRRHIGPPQGLDRAAWSPDGSTIAASVAAGILLLDVRTGRQRTLPIPDALIPAWSPDGRMLGVFRILSHGWLRRCRARYRQWPRADAPPLDKRL